MGGMEVAILRGGPVVVGEQVRLRRSAGRGEIGNVGGQAQVDQDRGGHVALGDGGDDSALAAAVRADDHVVPKYSRRQGSPPHAVAVAVAVAVATLPGP